MASEKTRPAGSRVESRQAFNYLREGDGSEKHLERRRAAQARKQQWLVRPSRGKK